jgi:hypothetical protein
MVLHDTGLPAEKERIIGHNLACDNRGDLEFRGAKKADLSLLNHARIENGTAGADSFGLEEHCRVASGIRTTPHEGMMEYERLVKEAGKAWWRLAERKAQISLWRWQVLRFWITQ